MHYLLSKEEMDDLQARALAGDRAPSEKDLQEFCTMVADTMPVEVDWIDEVRPWGCVITIEKLGGEHYCDECPAERLCPFKYKRWSK